MGLGSQWRCPGLLDVLPHTRSLQCARALATENGTCAGSRRPCRPGGRNCANRRYSFPVSKHRRDGSGSFSGITEISVLPKAFESFYASLCGNTSASYALIREDGAVLARHPVSARPGIVLDPATGFGQLIKNNPEGGHYTTLSAVRWSGTALCRPQTSGLSALRILQHRNQGDL